MKRGFSWRRTVSACWHVHGVFIDSLPKEAEVYSSPFKKWVKPGDKWNDKNIGSLACPLSYSDPCDCALNQPNIISHAGIEYHPDHWGN